MTPNPDPSDEAAAAAHQPAPTPARKGQQALRLLLWLLGLGLIATLLASPWLIWQFEPVRPLPLLIIDKTVPDRDYREHAALIWALNHAKIAAPQGAEAWQEKDHYWGFHPHEQPRKDDYGVADTLTTQHLQGLELLFIADTYGVYRQDFRIVEQVEEERRKSDKEVEMESPDYSPKIYGGLDDRELDLIEAYVGRGGHLIAEFNTLASPTHGSPRSRMEKLLGLKWSGWTGRFFSKLEDVEEVPAWARRHYKQHYGKDWDFKGPGWALVHEDSRIVVLQEGIDVPRQALHIYLNQPHPLLQEAYDKVPYTYWFDIHSANPGTQVLAEYRLQTLEPGTAQLKRFGLPDHFPFLAMASEQPLRLYFAGDVSDKFHTVGSYQLAGRGPWERFGRFKEANPTQAAFFWEFYLPVMQNILARLAPHPQAETQATTAP